MVSALWRSARPDRSSLGSLPCRPVARCRVVAVRPSRAREGAHRARDHRLQSARSLLHAVYAQPGGGTALVDWGVCRIWARDAEDVQSCGRPRRPGGIVALNTRLHRSPTGSANLRQRDQGRSRPLELPRPGSCAGGWTALPRDPALRSSARRSSHAAVLFGVVMLGIQAYVFFGPPPISDRAAAATAMGAYALFAGVGWLLERSGRITAAST
jgi:hypothetical protein